MECIVTQREEKGIKTACNFEKVNKSGKKPDAFEPIKQPLRTAGKYPNFKENPHFYQN